MTRATIGIDPGVHGAIAAHRGNAVMVFDIPTIAVKRGKRTRNEYDAAECARLIREATKGVAASIYLEDVRARPARDGKRDSLVSAHSIGVGIGLWLGIAAALRIPITLVAPSKWKRWAGLIGKDKGASRLAALRRYPQLAAQLRRVKDNDRAEALLIAAYGVSND